MRGSEFLVSQEYPRPQALTLPELLASEAKLKKICALVSDHSGPTQPSMGQWSDADQGIWRAISPRTDSSILGPTSTLKERD